MKWVLYILGVLFFLMGSVWILQGIGVLPGRRNGIPGKVGVCRDCGRPGRDRADRAGQPAQEKPATIFISRPDGKTFGRMTPSAPTERTPSGKSTLGDRATLLEADYSPRARSNTASDRQGRWRWPDRVAQSLAKFESTPSPDISVRH